MNDKALYELFGAREIMDLPAAVYKTLFADIRERDEIYRRLLELYNYDITYDWFQDLYEIEYAQRKKKQDFTPHSVTEIVSQIALEGKECTIHEPTAGTGGLIISAWWETIKNKIPWEIFPSKNFPADKANCGNCTRKGGSCPRQKSNKRQHNGNLYGFNGEVSGVIYCCPNYTGKYISIQKK